MKKTVDYYMSLPYQIEFEMRYDSGHPKYLAYIRELPRCRASVEASDSVEKLWRLLEEKQRKWITKRLERGLNVPEPPDDTLDPFWQEFPHEFDQHAIKDMLYEYGATLFPLRILETMWLGELENVRLREVETSAEAPPKARTPHGDQRTPPLRGDVRSVPLRGSLKKAWIKFDGPRTGRGYKDIEVLDQPLRTEAAIVAALTILEASTIEDADFEWLQKSLLEHVEARPALRGKPLQEVLDELPANWFLDQRSKLNNDLAKKLDKDLKALSDKKDRDKERRKRYKAMRNWERFYIHWERSIRYMVTLLHYRRPDFDQYPFEQQLELLNWHRKHTNKFLQKQRDYMTFVEYGSHEGTPTNVVKQAQDQVMAAVLKDVDGLSHLKIAAILSIPVKPDERYETDMKIPTVARLIKDGQQLLDEALKGEGGWHKRAGEMKKEGERYTSLTKEQKDVELLTENLGWSVEKARTYLRKHAEKDNPWHLAKARRKDRNA